MTKVAICDDEPQCLAWIQNLILLRGECTLPELRTFSESSALISAITEDGYLPDIAVLDIVMPGDSGIELAKQLNLVCPSCSIIFLSAHLSLATEVYETRHSYFVLKSQAAEKIGSALKKALEEQVSREHIYIHCNGREQLLPVSEVLFMERKLKKTLILQVSGNEYLVSAKPDELIQQLKSSSFVRCHQSFWVNLDHIRSMGPESFLLTTGQEIPISRSRRAEAKAAFHSFLCRSVLSHEF